MMAKPQVREATRSRFGELFFRAARVRHRALDEKRH
tara:strand:+ start:56 stop:163 length:108 start_codon:yes stop_codon:yes gene_type:complete